MRNLEYATVDETIIKLMDEYDKAYKFFEAIDTHGSCRGKAEAVEKAVCMVDVQEAVLDLLGVPKDNTSRMTEEEWERVRSEPDYWPDWAYCRDSFRYLYIDLEEKPEEFIRAARAELAKAREEGYLK